MADRSLRTRLPELALEAVMIVFAVVVALGVDEFREERQMRQLARQARAAVIAEVRANLEEFDTTYAPLAGATENLGRVLRAQDLELMSDGMGLELPDFSSAAWRAAQASQASSYLDYDWVIRVSRAYEAHAIYSRISDQTIDAFGGLVGQAPTLERLNAIYGRLLILVTVHDQVMEQLQGILDAEPSG